MGKVLHKKIIFLVIMGALLCVSCAQAMRMQGVSDLVNLFPKTAEEMTARVVQYMQEAQEEIDKIIAIRPQDRSFETVALALDRISCFSNLAIFLQSLEVLELVSPDSQVREAARDMILKIENFKIEQIDHNKKLYNVFKAYEKTSYCEYLSAEKRYFLEQTTGDYERDGLGLSKDLFDTVKRLKKELKKLEQEFITNITEDKTKLIIKRKELVGIDKGYIRNFKKDRKGNCILNCVDCYAFIGSCKEEETRKKLFITYNNQACPQNRVVLQKMMEKRDKLAQLLGFESYTHFDVDDQMAKTPKAVCDFLELLQEKISKKVEREFALLARNLPDEVTLTPDSKIKSWDEEYIKEWYIRNHFDVDLEKVSKYFPVDHVIDKMLEICEQFFGVRFNRAQVNGLWHQDVDLVEVYSQDGDFIGYILLDLYQRKNKYALPSMIQIVPAVTGHGPGANIIIAGFEKTTGNKAFLSLDDLESLFHEFGHAVHDLLGRTDMASFSGSNVIIDFAETPSQMLELWPFEKEMLKKISCHYRTKQPLADDTIDEILALRNFYQGNALQEECVFALFCLQCFSKSEDQDPKRIYKTIKSAMRTHIDMCEQDNKYASFYHVGMSEYISKYYAYLWSKVFAVDIFHEIKKHGFGNAEIGKKYVQEILCKGGSVDPSILLKNFLGRASRLDSFFDKYGLLQQEAQEGSRVWAGRLRKRKREPEQIDIDEPSLKRRKIDYTSCEKQENVLAWAGRLRKRKRKRKLEQVDVGEPSSKRRKIGFFESFA